MIRELVAKQAEDDGLWFIADTMPEAYLQQELRRLHSAIESESFVPVAALRALLASWWGASKHAEGLEATQAFVDCHDELAALCDAAEKEKNK